MKAFVAALVGLAIGVAGTWLYMDGRLQPALQRITQAESSRDMAAKAAKVLEEQIANAKQAGEKLQATGQGAGYTAQTFKELAAQTEFDVSIVNREVHAAAEELVALMKLGPDE